MVCAPTWHAAGEASGRGDPHGVGAVAWSAVPLLGRGCVEFGDEAGGTRAVFESWLGAELGRDPGCAACARHAEGLEAAALRRDEQALELWAPVLDGDLVCGHQPHGVLGSALLVLLRRDRLDEAIDRKSVV